MDEAQRRVEFALLAGAVAVYGVRREPEVPCSACGCASPAAEPAECDRPDCPLEGRERGQ